MPTHPAKLPPANMSARVLEYDFREGGHYRIELTYDDPAATGKATNRTDVSVGRFVALEAGKRIVQSVEFESADVSFGGEMRMTWSFGVRHSKTWRGIWRDHNIGVTESNTVVQLQSSSPRGEPS